MSESTDVALQAVRALGATPRVGVVLGSGLGAFADTLAERRSLPFSQIAGMPQATVAGHGGQLHWGTIEGTTVACLQGRVHAYEGLRLSDVVFGVRLLARWGVDAVLLTNAAGGVDPELAPGSFVLISDHLNLMGGNPLVGPNPPGGPRFPDLTEAYHPAVRAAIQRAAAELGLPLAEGVYAAMLGPSYETPAEIRMLRTLGARVVGMSTVPEIIALAQQGVPAAAISCVTNSAAGVSSQPLSHEEVQETASRVSQSFVQLLRGAVVQLGGGAKLRSSPAPCVSGG